MNKTLNKSEKEKQSVLAMLDAEDAKIPANPGLNTQAAGGEFEKLFSASTKEQDFRVGDVVTGTVVEVQSDYVLVDINYKSEGLIPINEFRMVDGVRQVKAGDQVEVLIDRIENDNGMISLSKDKADMLRAWTDISKAAENEEIIEGVVVAKVKGGLSVDIGVKAFLPGSQIDLRPVRNMDVYLGKKYKFKVIKFNKKRGNIVLSRRAILEEERDSLKAQTADTMKEGATVVGLVKNVTDYGAFIDLGGLDGLLHITDMSWGRVKHPSELINVGDEIQVKILKYDTEKERVSLGLKQLTEDPWANIKGTYQIGARVKGKVVSVAEYGAFVELGDGVEGLIHVSEMSWTKRVKHANQVVQVDQEVEVQVLEIDTENRRISLGMKQLQANPWIELKETYPPGTIIEGEVKSVTDFGIFVGIEDGIDGLVHISDFSWTKRVNHPSEMFAKGQKIRAVVLGVDSENERFSLGVKQLEGDPWSQIETKYGIGTQHDVKVTKTTDFGAFVELAADIEGLIHISELTTDKIQTVEDFVKVGETLKAEVITIDKDARKIGLSSKLVKLREAKADVDDYVKKATSTSKTSFGDMFGDQLKNLKTDKN
ncbi:30S ribosomal protein S1 [Pseudobdellovibrio exovorus]|uniref:Small ribosomal subunit protein bS1 n=1 Tax=Pseudobdellovibrio exovorus JSS TaxID=1184267 RepID=M4V9D7_9BACT|nr:30S ribosomal protein S1 [Pseudobdellovibrio exovorus]AGH95055.1 30S ribosomal protein S1 [Pseudobdellovibrio exovorus JSS]